MRANVFTVFNLILAVAGAATLAFGEWQDALFLGVLLSNSAIGITQELRAKRALDRLAALVAPTATVVRDGTARVIPVADVVEGDLLRLQPGDQVAADGELVRADALALDESILTGESRPVLRRAGERARSGSFVVEGAGELVAEAVGGESYAARIAGEARAFRHPRSPLEHALNRLLLTLVAIIAPLGVILGVALWERRTPLGEAVPTSVAAVVTLVPEGLILLASLTYAVAALRMASRGALAQQLNAIESLASVDVVCLDKTGTLTEPRLQLLHLIPAAGVSDEALRAEAAVYAATSPVRNATVAALAEATPGSATPPAATIPFSSRRRFGAVERDDGWVVLGAPELFSLGGLAGVAAHEADAGRRVVALATSAAGISGEGPPPRGAHVLGLAVLTERLRPEARATVEFFRRQGVELKVLSGDRPETVRAVAADVGIPADRVADGRELPETQEELAALLRSTSVIGRISPEAKRRVVEALREEGRYVAMVGDGVNDVPALKAARLAIAQGTGTQMAKSVADIVLVSGDFGAVPAMVAEGRRILRNLRRVTKLFVTKAAFAVALIVSIGLTPTAYPLLPRHLTLAATLAIGVPSFFLALAPSRGPYHIEGFLREVSSFSVPAGTAAGLGVLSSYLFALNVLDLPLVEARTVATTVLVTVGLYLILALEASGRRRGTAVSALCLVLASLYLLTLAVPFTREFFELAAPGPVVFATALAGAAFAIAGLGVTAEKFLPGGSRDYPPSGNPRRTMPRLTDGTLPPRRDPLYTDEEASMREDPLMSATPIVEARGVVKTYDTGKVQVHALRGIDLTIARGEMVSVMGPSGCGKTTLLNCLSGLDAVDTGEILIEGVALSQLSDRARTDYRARRMGFVFQFYNLMPVLNAVENVELPLLVARVPGKEARRKALEALDLVGLAQRATHIPDELSGGERQRVTIARSLVNDPAIVWADEPTGDLDSENAEEISDLMRRLNVERGLTFVLVTHDVDVGRKADRLVRMVDGEIVEQEQLLPPRRETFEAAHDGARAGVF